MHLLLSTLAWAATPQLDAGVGVREQYNAFDGVPYAVHAYGRVGWGGRFAVEGELSGAFPGDHVSNLTETLVAIAYEGNNETTFQQPVNRELAAVGALVDLSPWARPHGLKVAMWPYALVGVEVRIKSYNFARINPDYANAVEGADPAALGTPTIGVVPSPAAGAGFDIWFHDRAGVRMSAMERIAVEQEPDYGNRNPDGSKVRLGNEVTFAAVFSLDGMVRF